MSVPKEVKQLCLCFPRSGFKADSSRGHKDVFCDPYLSWAFQGRSNRSGSQLSVPEEFPSPNCACVCCSSQQSSQQSSHDDDSARFLSPCTREDRWVCAWDPSLRQLQLLNYFPCTAQSCLATKSDWNWFYWCLKRDVFFTLKAGQCIQPLK